MDVKRLLAWYRKGARDLPWRRSRDPYAIWVSEIMLQQTQIDTVLPYYARWMKRFPTVKALAKAEQDDVLKMWEGLGYYARARNLHKAARSLTALPKTAEAWREVPGVGAYTAAAIASIAHGERVAVFDGNVRRVLSRLDGADVTENPTITDELGVQAVPTLLVFRDGEEIARYEGPYSREALNERLTNLMAGKPPAK